MPFITPKTDWTESDAFNGSDLNRIENNIGVTRNLLVSLDYPIASLTIDTSRTVTEFDTVSSINRIEANLETLKSSFVTPITWQNTITWTPDTALTEVHANRWEQSVKDLYELAQQAQEGFRICGTFNSGQEVLLP